MHAYAAHRFYLKGRLDLAIVELREAIRLFPESGLLYPHLLLGNIYHELGQKRLAFAAYRGALLEIGECTYRAVLTLALEATGTPADVIAAFRDAIRAKPIHPGLHIGLAKVLLAHGHRDEAFIEFHEAIRLEPNDPKTYTEFAWDLATLPEAKQRDGKSAVEFATKACELTEWKDPCNLDALSAAFAESGDFDSAVKWQTKAIGLLSDEKEKEDYRTRLQLYQKRKPYRSASSRVTSSAMRFTPVL